MHKQICLIYKGMQEQTPLVGIDYGSKLAGTTVLAYSHDRQEVRFVSSRKGEDADVFLLKMIHSLGPEQIFIDAPLSLPGVYKELPDFDDFFYRQADRALKAMSPMFLGGLTARAMQLAAQLAKDNIRTFEAYPAALARQHGFQAMGYKKQKEAFFSLKEQLVEIYHLKLPSGLPYSWHYFDALLALVTALRTDRQEVMVEGAEEEGVIFF